MSNNRRRKKIDSNQNELIEELLARGVSVAPDHDDILCGHGGKTYWFEIKASEAASKVINKTTIAQKKIEDTWKGHYKIVWSLDMILEDIGIN